MYKSANTVNSHFKSDLISNQTSILYGLFIFGNKRVKERKTCMCLLFFLDVDISGTIFVEGCKLFFKCV